MSEPCDENQKERMGSENLGPSDTAPDLIQKAQAENEDDGNNPSGKTQIIRKLGSCACCDPPVYRQFNREECIIPNGVVGNKRCDACGGLYHRECLV